MNPLLPRFRQTFATLALAGCALLPQWTHADTLDEVTKAGVIRIALTLDYPPFGMIDKDMQPKGYDVEFAHLLGQHLGLKVELVKVVHASKIPTMATRKADVLLNLGENAERAKVVDFSQPYAPYFVGVYGTDEVAVKAVADLAHKRIAVTRGTIEDQLLTKMAPDNAKVLRYDDHTATISAFISGQAQLISTGNIVAAAIMERRPARMPKEKFLLMNSPVRTAVTKGEQGLLEKVNTAIAEIKQSGKLQALSQHWLQQSLPANF